MSSDIVRIGIFICNRYHTCAGGKCLRSIRNREGAFSIYKDREVELVGYTTCDGCPGGNIEYAPAEMKKNGTVKKTILLINSANALQVDFLKNNEYDIDAALWIGDVGISGINAVAEILTGKVNPSGSLVDTYCYDNFSAPAMWNFTPTTYEGYVEGGDVSAKAKSYMIY